MFAKPYITESMSGERDTPCIYSSSPVFTMIDKSIFFNLLNPFANLAPPIPPLK